MFNHFDSKIMKKLKKFVLNDAKVLSEDELASIEGSLCINALDNCTVETKDQACVYSVTYAGGHQSITLGTCMVTYTQVGNMVIATDAFCG